MGDGNIEALFKYLQGTYVENAKELNIIPSHRSTVKMRLHIRSCEALLEKGVSLKDSDYQSNYHFRKTGMKPAPKKKEDEEDNEDDVIKDKFLLATDDELKGMGFSEPRQRLTKRCAELWANFLVNDETGEAVCKACRNTFAMVSFCFHSITTKVTVNQNL